MNNLTAKVKAKIGPLYFPYALEQTDACQNSNLECPLQPGQQYIYEASVKILPIYPKVNLKLDLIRYVQ